MADHPVLLDPAAAIRLELHLDAERKIPRAIESLGPVAGRDVVLVDGGGGRVAGALADLGARVTALERGRPDAEALVDARAKAGPTAPADRPGTVTRQVGEPAALGLPAASADVIVSCWSAYRGIDEAELAEADRVLRPGGRLLVVHDYGRDDVSRLADPDRPEYGTWGRRDGPFLKAGFRVRVLHAWWTFASVEEATELLERAFGPRGAAVAAELHRPRLSWNVAVYHRDRPS